MKKIAILTFVSCVIGLAACDQRPAPHINETASQSVDNSIAGITSTQNAPSSHQANIHTNVIKPSRELVEPASLAVSSPAKYQPASSADAKSGLASDLLANLTTACEDFDQATFFTLFTERVRYGFSKMSKEKLGEYFSDFCRTFPSISEPLKNGVAISPDSYSKEDGQFISNMCAKTIDGICKQGIDVGLEGGKLKLSEW